MLFEVLFWGVEFGNVKVVDFLLYDFVLEYVDVMVFNVGYGGFVYCIVNGVFVVVVGLMEDKCEVLVRVEWMGVGINLRIGRFMFDVVVVVVDMILGDDKYWLRVWELVGYVVKGNFVEVVEKEIIVFL